LGELFGHVLQLLNISFICLDVISRRAAEEDSSSQKKHPKQKDTRKGRINFAPADPTLPNLPASTSGEQFVSSPALLVQSMPAIHPLDPSSVVHMKRDEASASANSSNLSDVSVVQMQHSGDHTAVSDRSKREASPKVFKSAAGLPMTRRGTHDIRPKGDIRSSEWFIGDRRMVTPLGSRRSLNGERESEEKRTNGRSECALVGGWINGEGGESGKRDPNMMNRTEADQKQVESNPSDVTSPALSSHTFAASHTAATREESHANAIADAHAERHSDCDLECRGGEVIPLSPFVVYDHVTYGAPAAFVRRFDAGHNLRHLLKKFSQKAGVGNEGRF
jgi:hypothetical protein